ncbi:MAG: HNH endonuclease [Chloroflexi bacterium]|nr:HNH endonuclease [Chloroflexota bacterium]
MPGRNKDLYSSSQWRRTRLVILERDHYQCQIKGSRCTHTATEVDHIIPITQGGSKLDPTNLRAACHNCNNGRIDRQRNNAWRTAGCHITLVMGPPAAGKSTYVREHARAGDLIVDYDAIAESLGADPHQRGQALHPAINAARNAILRALRAGTTGASRAWIISAHPQADSKFPYHDVICIDPGLEVARANAQAANRPADYRAAIERWYEARAAVTDLTSSREW